MSKLEIDQILKQAVISHKAGNMQDTRRLLNSILMANPKHPDANHNMGVLHASHGEVETALPFFKVALEANFKAAQFWYSYIDALIKLQRFAEAKTLLDQAKSKGAQGHAFDELARRMPNLQKKSKAERDPTAGQLQSLINLYHQGQLKEALKNASLLVKNFPHSATLYNLCGVFNAGLNHYEASIYNYKKALKVRPDFVDVHCNMGHAFKASGDLSAAIKSYEDALNFNPNYIDAIGSLAVALREQGNLGSAINSYRRALKIEPENAEICYNLGNVLKERGEISAAIDSYKRALQIKPTYLEACNNLGLALMDAGDTGGAIKSYERALQINPVCSDAYNNMGLALVDVGDIGGAINSYKQALQIKPDYAEAHHNIGIALANKGDLQAAVDSYKEALKLRPDFASALNNLGLALMEKGNLDCAVEKYQDAIKVDPDCAPFHNNIGLALQEKGDVVGAIASYKNALKIDPDCIEAAVNLALLPNSHIGAEELKILKEILVRQLSFNEHCNDLKCLEAHVLRHAGDSKASFHAMCVFNMIEAQRLTVSIDSEHNKNKLYLRRLQNWTPKPATHNPSLIKKLFILAPSRSGKTSLELLLSKSDKVKPLGEAINIAYDKKFVFNDLFYRDEVDLKTDGFEVVISTRPSTINYVVELYQKLPDCYFIFVDRHLHSVASEIFFKKYQEKNFHSYDKAALINYLKFYSQAKDLISTKIQSRTVSLNFEEIIEQPYKVIQKVGAFLSLDLEVQEKETIGRRPKLISDYDQYIKYLKL